MWTLCTVYLYTLIIICGVQVNLLSQKIFTKLRVELYSWAKIQTFTTVEQYS